jgi:hemoglobin-like flavoprotein
MAVATTTAELMAQSLALVERDIVPEFFARFFAGFPAEERNFHNRATSQGTMINEMISFLLALAEGEDWLPTLLQTQVLTHHDKGDIALERYRDSLRLLVDVLADAAGPGWNAEHDHAWHETADRLYAMIERYY